MKKVLSLLLGSLVFLFISTQVSAESDLLPKRLSGTDRFEVAVNVSDQGWPHGANTVILSNYNAFADALAAAPLAYKLNAPILLTQSNILTDSTKKQIQKLSPNEVILVGGTGSISIAVSKQVSQLVPKVTRIGGADRFVVASNIAKKLNNPESKAVVVNGLIFPDALTIAPYAAKYEMPILLSVKDRLPEATKSIIQQKGIDKTYIIGGEGSVARTVSSKLPSPERIGGRDRFEVAGNIIRKFNLNTAKTYIATGTTFADALTGSVLAAKEQAPLLLTMPKGLPDGTDKIIREKNIWNFTILGGPGSVNPKTIYPEEQWKLEKRSFGTIEGYTSKSSFYPGDFVTFYVDSPQSYKMEFYRMGYNEGSGGMLVHTLNDMNAHIQTASIDPKTFDANWSASQQFAIPSNWTSGFYLTKLTMKDGRSSYIPFVIKERNPDADFAIVIATNTYQAYNSWGGKSLYGYNSIDGIPADKISFNRPYKDNDGSGQIFMYEYNFIRWAEKNNYSVTYLTNEDIHNGYLNEANINSVVIPGHDEYWTKEMRDSIESKTKSNLNLAVLNANVGYWQVRYEDEARALVGYKNNAANDPFHEIDPLQVTTKFRNAPVNRPEKEVFGIMYQGIPKETKPLVVTNANHWIYEGTGLQNGDKINGVIGGEVDRYDGGISGVEVLASSPVVLYGENSHADMVWFNKPEGGKTFATGTFYWNWFLDSYGHESKATYNSKIETITKNAMDRLRQN